MDDVARENDMGEISLTPENKVDTIMNAKGSEGTGSMNQESHDVNESATPSSVISSQEIVDENEIKLQIRNTTNQIKQDEDGKIYYTSEYKAEAIANAHGLQGTGSMNQESHGVDKSMNTMNQIGHFSFAKDPSSHMYEFDSGNEQVVGQTSDENPSNPTCSMCRHLCCNKYAAFAGSFIVGSGLTAVMILQYILGLIILGAFGLLATIYLCWFCVMKNGHYCCKKFGACLGIFGALLFVCGLSFAIPWYTRYHNWHYSLDIVLGILGIVGAIGGLAVFTMYLCWMSLKQNISSPPVADVLYIKSHDGQPLFNINECNECHQHNDNQTI